MSQQRGFTLIELIVVLVLLGIVGAAATARFQDMSADAATIAVRGVAAELSSASAINYAADVLGTAGHTNINTAAVDCAGGDVDALFQSGELPTGYTFATGTFNCVVGGQGAPFTCTVNRGAASADAQLICTN